MDIELYIAGSRVDLSDGTYIQWTWQFSDTSDPVTVKNSYTQSISLPATANNVRLMSNFGRLDFNQPASGSIKFQKKVPFVIYDRNGVIQQQGYCKVDEVTRDKYGVVAYKVTLYGGLGSLFYAMMYDDDGNELDLSALTYEGYESGSFPMTADNLLTNWASLKAGEQPTFAFAVCYNGYPKCKFDANKAVYSAGTTADDTFKNLYTYKADGSTEYTAKLFRILLELENKHTDIEMQDLRAYLQRVCISVAGLVKAVASASSTLSNYTLSVDDAVYTLFDNLYMTLPMFERDSYEPKTATLTQVLAGTKSPGLTSFRLLRCSGSVSWSMRSTRP